MARRPVIIPFIQLWCKENPGKHIACRELAQLFIQTVDRDMRVPTFTCYVNNLAHQHRLPRDCRYDIQRPAPGENKVAYVTSTAWTMDEVAIFIDGLFHGFWPNRRSAEQDAINEGWVSEITFEIKAVWDVAEHHAMLDEFERLMAQG
jgi:hypothetical protein